MVITSTFAGVLSLKLGQSLGHEQDVLLVLLVLLQLHHGLSQQAALLSLQLLGCLPHIIQVLIQQLILGLVQVVQENGFTPCRIGKQLQVAEE